MPKEKEASDAESNKDWEFSPFFGTEGYIQRTKPLIQLTEANLSKLKYGTRIILGRKTLRGKQYLVQCYFVNYDQKEKKIFYSFLDGWSLPQIYRLPIFKNEKRMVFEHVVDLKDVVMEKSYIFNDK